MRAALFRTGELNQLVCKCSKVAKKIETPVSTNLEIETSTSAGSDEKDEMVVQM